ncbi:TRAP transporter substrate-binding protein [Halobacteriales archaeon QS_3_64_16]|nr:MAG: TRAP transporter substrate-binding protein [Halobacteriales archaeon QS_3_64_16]
MAKRASNNGIEGDRPDRRQFLRRTAGIGATAGVFSLAGCLNQSLGEGGGGGGSGGGGNGSGGGGGNGGGPTNIVLGTSSEGSSSFRVGSTFAQYVTQNDLADTFTIEAVVTEGTSATYRRVADGNLLLGGTTTQLLENSPNEGSFEDTQLPNFDTIRQIRGYMSFYNFGVANAEAGIQNWEDLQGRPIAVSSAGSGTRAPVERIIDEEIGLGNVQPRYMAFADIPSALRGGRVDAAFTWATNGTIPQGWFQEIDSTVNWAPLPLSESTQSILADELGFSSYVQIDGSAISENVSQSIDAFTLTYLWNARADMLSQEVVYELTKLSYERAEELVEQDEVMGFFPDPQEFLGTLHPDIPIHAGAYQYYQEEGLWSEYSDSLTAPPQAEMSGSNATNSTNSS